MTDKTQAALKLALELALDVRANANVRLAAKAIALTGAIDAALAEQPAQQQKPVAWRVKVETKLRDGSVDVGYQLRNGRLSEYDEPLYTSPQSKPWVGLTNNELQPICDEYRILFGSWVEDFARAIEAKLRERNEHWEKNT